MENLELDFSLRIKNVFPTHGGLEYVIQTNKCKYTLTGADFRRIGEEVLFAGNVLSDDEAEELEFCSEKLSCLQKYIKHLEYAPMYERKLRMKLHGKFPCEVIDSAIEILKENGYIDDLRLAFDLCEEYFVRCFMGPAKIKAKLYEKGFSREILSQILGEYEFSDEMVCENMKSLLRKKFGEEISKEDKPKALEYLVRWGYSFDDAKSVLKILY